MLKIGIDAHHIGKNKTGAEVYLKELIRNLPIIDSKNEYHIFISEKGRQYAKKYENIINLFFHTIKANNLFYQRFVILPIIAKKLKLDVLHVHRIAPRIKGTKLVVTIHDIAHELYPDNFSRQEAIAMKFLVPKAARKAAIIITDSTASKSDLITYYKLNPEKIIVTSLGINNDIFKPINDEKQLEKTLRKYKIKRPFVLYIGSIEPRKNIEVVIKAAAVIKTNNQLDFDFVIAGQPRSGKEEYKGMLIRLINANNLASRIKFLGHINASDLPFLYNAASLFVFPSFYEGFGFPPLEAMACGTPTIVANASSLASVVGNAALKVDAKNVNEWAETINSLINNKELRTELSARGIKHVSKFSWNKLAKQTLCIYQEVVAEKRGTINA